MLASMIFRKEPFFHGHDNYDQVFPFYFYASPIDFLSVDFSIITLMWWLYRLVFAVLPVLGTWYPFAVTRRYTEPVLSFEYIRKMTVQ